MYQLHYKVILKFIVMLRVVWQILLFMVKHSTPFFFHIHAYKRTKCFFFTPLTAENNSVMLNYSLNNGNDGNQNNNNNNGNIRHPYNILPTLLAMGQSANATPDIQRHIVRAIDNLSSQGRLFLLLL